MVELAGTPRKCCIGTDTSLHRTTLHEMFEIMVPLSALGEDVEDGRTEDSKHAPSNVVDFGGGDQLKQADQNSLEERVDCSEPWLFACIPSRDPLLHPVPGARLSKTIITFRTANGVVRSIVSGCTHLCVASHRPSRAPGRAACA